MVVRLWYTVLMYSISTVLLFSTFAEAQQNPCENILAVEQAFDKNNDNLVDASDWAMMSKAEKKAYARRSVIAVGATPDADAGNGHTRASLYLSILNRLYLY